MAKATTQPKAKPELVWVYVMDETATGIKDYLGNPVGKVEKGKIYFADKGDAQISADGSTKLLHLDDNNGLIDPQKIDAIVKAANAQPAKPATKTTTKTTRRAKSTKDK